MNFSRLLVYEVLFVLTQSVYRGKQVRRPNRPTKLLLQKSIKLLEKK